MLPPSLNIVLSFMFFIVTSSIRSAKSHLCAVCCAGTGGTEAATGLRALPAELQLTELRLVGGRALKRSHMHILHRDNSVRSGAQREEKCEFSGAGTALPCSVGAQNCVGGKRRVRSPSEKGQNSESQGNYAETPGRKEGLFQGIILDSGEDLKNGELWALPGACLSLDRRQLQGTESSRPSEGNGKELWSSRLGPYCWLGACWAPSPEREHWSRAFREREWGYAASLWTLVQTQGEREGRPGSISLPVALA